MSKRFDEIHCWASACRWDAPRLVGPAIVGSRLTLLAAVAPPLRLVTAIVTVVLAPLLTSATVPPNVAVLLAWPES